jgi:Uncharacterised nucleotidyltransferase
VTVETLPTATALILGAGYRRGDPPSNIGDAQLQLLMRLRKDLGFIHQSTGLRIELHWRLFLNPHAMIEASIRAASRVVPLAGVEGLRTLGEEDQFTYLCMHGALHWWVRLKWLADVNALLTSTPESGIERLVQAAQARGAGRAVALALVLCQKLLQTPLAAAWTSKLEKSAPVRWCEATALKAMTSEHDPQKVRFGTIRGSLSTVFLSCGWRYRFAELGVQLTNSTDVVTLQLPHALQFLYPVLRLPLWVWRQVGNQNTRGWT